MAAVFPRTASAYGAFRPVRAVSRFRLQVDLTTRIWCAVLGAAIVILAGIPLSIALNIWVDEAFTLHTTGAGAGYAWSQSIAFEGQPPLYFVIESIWRTLNEKSIAFARLPSVAFAAAAVAIIVLAAARIAPRVPSPIVAVVTAINPIVIWAAVEMRVYALVFLVGAVLTWSFFEGFLVPRPSRRAQIWYTIFAIAGLFTQYYVGFVILAHLLTVLTVRRASWNIFLGTCAIIGIAFAPFMRVAFMHVKSSGSFVAHISFVRAVREIATTVFMYILPHDLAANATVKVIGFAMAGAVLIVLFVVGRIYLPTEAAHAIMVQWLVCLAVFSFVFSTFGLPTDPLRHLIVLAPMSLIIALLIMSSLTRIRIVAGKAATIGFVSLAAMNLWLTYQPLAKPGEWRSVAATLRASDRATPIAVFPAELAVPLSVYLRLPTIAIPRPMPYSVDYVHAATLRNEADVARAIDSFRSRFGRLWLVTNGPCHEAPGDVYAYNCRYVDAYMHRFYHEARSIKFHGALATLYVELPKFSAGAKVAVRASSQLHEQNTSSFAIGQ